MTAVPEPAPTGHYTYPQHRRDHWQGNRPADCADCQRETNQAFRAMVANEAYRDLYGDQDRSARGLAVAVLLMAATLTGLPGLAVTWAWLTQINNLHAWHAAGPVLLVFAAWCLHRVWKIGQSA